mmetsp:Transcript_45048/g.70617  ORF Transcript_45048/g.70617 Transcript_45048/m.70617 type:complete len:217 (+) Transcript_45048:31-681(+)
MSAEVTRTLSENPIGAVPSASSSRSDGPRPPSSPLLGVAARLAARPHSPIVLERFPSGNPASSPSLGPRPEPGITSQAARANAVQGMRGWSSELQFGRNSTRLMERRSSSVLETRWMVEPNQTEEEETSKKIREIHRLKSALDSKLDSIRGETVSLSRSSSPTPHNRSGSCGRRIMKDSKLGLVSGDPYTQVKTLLFCVLVVVIGTAFTGSKVLWM